MRDVVRVRVRGDRMMCAHPAFCEPVSVPILTPTAAEGILKSVLRKVAFCYDVIRIKVLADLKYEGVFSNGVNNLYPTQKGRGTVLQRHSLYVIDVDYIIEARIRLTDNAWTQSTVDKFWHMFYRRLNKGQCGTPFLGTSECPCSLSPLRGDEPPPIPWTQDLGLLHWGWDCDWLARPQPVPKPIAFRARVVNGVMEVPRDPKESLGDLERMRGGPLRELYLYAKSRDLLKDVSYEERKVRWVFVLDLSGKLLQVQENVTSSPDKKAQKVESMQIPVPPLSRTGLSFLPVFLADHSDYVLGLDAEGQVGTHSGSRHTTFISQVERATEETKDQGLVAILRFLKEQPKVLPDGYKGGDRIVFALETPESKILSRPDVRSWWDREFQSWGGLDEFCWITGKMAPSAILHPKVKIPGTSSEGAPLVSFNQGSMLKYKQHLLLKEGGTKPTNFFCSKEAADGVAAAANSLLSSKEGSYKAFNRMSVLWWTESPTQFCSKVSTLFHGAPKDSKSEDAPTNREVVEGTVETLRNVNEEDHIPFFFLILVANMGRVQIHSWGSTYVGKVRESLLQHYEDLGEYFPMWQLVSMFEDEDKRIHWGKVIRLLQAALTGEPYPCGMSDRMCRLAHKICCTNSEDPKQIMAKAIALMDADAKRKERYKQ